MKRRPFLLGSLALCGACALFAAPYGPPPGTKAIPPFPQYAQWWLDVERCSGKVRPMSEITWYVTPGFTFDYGTERSVYGVYVAPGAIIMADMVSDLGPEVRHEMLHAIENSDSHTTHHGACKELVAP